MAATTLLTTPDPLISYHEARSRVLAGVPPSRRVRRGLDCLLGCVAAADVPADTDAPPFRKSFMDGYALRSADARRLPATLKCVGEVAAGAAELPRFGAGECVRIMTGAPLPPDADAVQMVEKTRVDGDRVEMLETVEAGSHIAEQGSEVRKGDVVVEAGRYLGPAEIGVLAGVGATEVAVWEPPAVAIVPTGDELVSVDAVPAFGQVRNSSARMLAAQCRLLGLQCTVLDPVADTREATLVALERARAADLILFTGGVSMGEHDYVHRVLGEAGVELVFHKAAIKPGKPLLVGRDGDRLVIGLPGNPVSSFVTFELFVRPAAQRWMGLETVGLRVRPARLDGKVERRPGRLWFMPAVTRVRNDRLVAEPVTTRGSADLTAFARANSLVMVPLESGVLEEGADVEVMLLEGREP